MMSAERAFAPGARILSRNRPSQVGVVVKVEDGYATVFWAGGLQEVVDLDSLVLEQVPQAAGSPSDLALALTFARLEHPLTDQLLSFRASRTRFLPHQFIPVRKLVGNPSRRILIADEVGTGKTIEAGLVWAELEARSPGGLESVLVVCPRALVRKWQDEFLHRFDLRLEAFGPAEWRGALLTAQRDGCLSARFSHGVVGLELARRDEHLALLTDADCTWDLVIIDEAHELRNPATMSNALGQALAGRAGALLLLTATPAQTSLEDLRNLLLLLRVDLARDRAAFEREIVRDSLLNEVARLMRKLPPGWREAYQRNLERLGARLGPSDRSCASLVADLPSEEPTPAERVEFLRKIDEAQSLAPFMTRTLRGDIDVERPVRQAGVRRVRLPVAHEEFYQAVYQIALKRADRDGVPAGFACQMLERRTASCVPSVAREVLGVQKIGEDDPEIKMAFTGEEASALATVSRRALLETDPKAETLLTAIRELMEEGYPKILVFSTFRGTLSYLEERLRDAGLRVAQINGDVPHCDRDCGPDVLSREAIASRFRRGFYDVLLGSEVIGQGLDFEHCSALINYDLPWNPMRIEQRIGRIDRLGQRAPKIMIVNLSTPGTVESRILERLFMRLDIFERALGEFEAVLGEELDDFAEGLFSSRLSAVQQEETLDRIARAAEARRQEAALVMEEQGTLISALQRVELERTGFELPEKALLAAEEIQSFVVETFTRSYGDRSAKVRNDGLVDLDLEPAGDDLRTLWKGLPARSSARERIRILAARAATRRSRVRLSFADAEYREGVEFAHVRHPVVLLCRHLWRSKLRPTSLSAGVVGDVAGLEPGRYVAGWAIAGFEGLVSRVDFVEVVLDAEGREVALAAGVTARDLLSRAEPVCAPLSAVDAETVRRDLERHIVARADAGRPGVAERNTSLAEKAKAAIESEIATRRVWLEERLGMPGLDVRIRRMYGAWHSRLLRDLEDQLEALARRAELQFRCQYIGAFVIDIAGPSEDSEPPR